ncbi:MAG TPA: plastocyanin/azurin family copper-binding protein [bacterium]|nr:plastocyanin/azurin family copper-binding protein [bacterium]
MKRIGPIALCVTLVMLSIAALPARGAGRTWTVIVGGGTKDGTVFLNAFFPRTLEVATGDTVRWQFEGFHNVAFLGGTPMPPLVQPAGNDMVINPNVVFPVGGGAYAGEGYINSGIALDPTKPHAYSVTFTKPGTYRYVCVVHGPAMGGTVVVKDAVTGSPAALLREARRQQAAAVAGGQSMWKRFRVIRQGRDVAIPLIGDARVGASIFRFTPAPLRVTVGTTVTWQMADPFEIHTVTFTSGKRPPTFELIRPQQQGPPKVLLNPVAARPSGHRNYDGTGFVNSGILYPPQAPAGLPKNYSLTFLKAGRYEYWCITHAPYGMKGVIIVE